MSLTITQRPAAWTGARSPIIYKMQRKDQAFNTITNNGGTIRITVNLLNVSANYTVGDEVYVKSDDGTYDAIGTVTAKAFSTNTTIDVDIAYTVNTTTGYINNNTTRPLYKVLVNLYDPTTNTALLSAPLTYTPDHTGLATIDVQILKSLLTPEIAGLVTYGQSSADENKFIDFYIGYSERWTGSANSETLDSANARSTIFGAMPIKGANDYSRVSNNLPYFIQDFLIWFGAYWDLTFYGLKHYDAVQIEHYQDGSLAATDSNIKLKDGVCRVPVEIDADDDRIIIREDQGQYIFDGTDWVETMDAFTTKTASGFTASLNSAGGSATFQARMPIKSFSRSTFNNILVSVARSGTFTGNSQLKVRAVQDNGNYIEQAGSVVTTNATSNVTLTTASSTGSGDAANAGYLVVTLTATISSGTQNYTITIPNGSLFYTRAANVVTEYADIPVSQLCDNAVLLTWCNEQGGQEWWVFQYNQEISYTYDGKQNTRRLLLFSEDLTLTQWNKLNQINTIGEVYKRSISELTTSILGTSRRIDSQVYLLLNDNTLLEVVVVPSSMTTRSNSVAHTMTLQIELPEGFIGDSFLLN